MKTIEQQLKEKALKRFNGDVEAMEKNFAKFMSHYEGLTVAQAKRYSALFTVDNFLYADMRKSAEFFYNTYKFFDGYELKVTESGVWAVFRHNGYAALAFEVRYAEYCRDETVVRTTVLDDSGLSHCIVSTEKDEFFCTFDPSVFVDKMKNYVPNIREIRRTVFHGIEDMVGREKETKYGIWEGYAAIQNEIGFYESVMELRRFFTDEELERMAVWSKKYPWFNPLLKKIPAFGYRRDWYCRFAEWAERLEKDLEKSDAELAEFIRLLRTGKRESTKRDE